MAQSSQRFTFGCVLGIAFAIGACSPSRIDPRPTPPPPRGNAEKVGPGFFTKAPPPGEKVATDRRGRRVEPKVTDSFKAVPKSNTWWSSLIWQFDEKNPYSFNLYAHPLVLRAQKKGLGLSYPVRPEIKPRHYMQRFSEDIRVGLEGLASQETRVSDYSDWTVTAEWESGENALSVTLGHGLPFVYATKRGPAAALIRVPRPKSEGFEVVRDEGNALHIRVAEHNYGLFAPTGSRWTREDLNIKSDLGGKDYFSVAVLPNDSAETFALFKKHAFAFVKGSRASWAYDEESAMLETRYTFETNVREEGKDLASEPLVALYRHQWKHTDAALLDLEYSSARGAMKCLAAQEFKTRSKFNGVLPLLANAAKFERSDLDAYIDEIYGADDLFPKGFGPKPERDSYWAGKSLGRNITVMQIADQVGYADARDRLLRGVQNELEDWFDGRAPRHFYYDEAWRSLVAFPSSYGSSEQLNDHHFHYGYFVGAAAAVARYDRAWAKRWAPFVEILIKDAANWDREDARFPFLRHMDVYAGHSWANGPAQFEEGNNQEASSEDINFSGALVLWGALMDNRELRDLGIFLYQNQVLAAENYWFDIENAVFPKSFEHSTVGMVWGAGAKYDTWFDQDPVLIHGINFLPFSGSALYLGRHPAYVQKNFDEMWKRARGVVYTWRDYALMYLALSDPKKAAELLDDDTYFEPEFGNSRAMLHHWIGNLAAINGTVDTKVNADIPTYAVFRNKRTRTYMAFNPSRKPLVANFSDGTKLSLGPGALAHKQKEISEQAD